MRSFAALLLVLGLTACGWYELPRCDVCALDRDDTFTATDSAGLLVYGLTVNPAMPPGEVEGQVSWLIEPPRAATTFAGFHSIAFPKEMATGRRRLVIWRVPPGMWSLRQMSWSMDGQSGATPPQGGRMLAAEVLPGQVTYVGELTLLGSRKPAEIAVGGDEAAARASLAAYPGVTAPLRVTPLRDLRSRPPGSGRGG